MRTLLLFFFLSLAVFLKGNEPLWTDHERAEHRQAVIIGEVVSIDMIESRERNENIHLMCATVIITSVEKGEKFLDADRIATFHYETSPLGAGYRCPSFPILEVGQPARFYLRHDDGLTKKGGLVLEMGSDVQTVPTAEPDDAGNGENALEEERTP